MIYLHDGFSYKEININSTNESNLFESLLVEIWRKDFAYQKFVVGDIIIIIIFIYSPISNVHI